MNNEYFGKQFSNSPIFAGNTPLPNQQTAPNLTPSEIPFEQSYIENILRMNKGKKVRVHMTFPDSNEWRDREFTGIIEESGRDHIILSEPDTGKWQLLLMIYVDFISFDESINYNPQFVPIN